MCIWFLYSIGSERYETCEGGKKERIDNEKNETRHTIYMNRRRRGKGERNVWKQALIGEVIYFCCCNRRISWWWRSECVVGSWTGNNRMTRRLKIPKPAAHFSHWGGGIYLRATVLYHYTISSFIISHWCTAFAFYSKWTTREWI